ncbi:MAG: hypothetical protein DHS20C12_11770 [Pseudohongiella sp.]|nr:MAG: hypothetical protein DHS20C12_11770 [Pseudohongiella sp.]
MKAAEIRAGLLAKGLTYTSIANILNVSQVAVSGVAHRTKTSHRIAVAICTALDKSTSEVFPDCDCYQRPLFTKSEITLAEQKLGARLRDLQLTGT